LIAARAKLEPLARALKRELSIERTAPSYGAGEPALRD
jgi:hypothetical protein